MSVLNKLFVGAMAVALVAGRANRAGAADREWVGGGALPNWSTTENWSGGQPPSAGDRPVFAGTSGLTSLNDFAWNTAYAGLLFADTAGSFTVGGNPISLGGDITNLSANAQTVGLTMALGADRAAVAAGGEIRITGQLTGNGGLIKSGSQRVTLSGPNSYAGKTRVYAGTLAVTTAVPVAVERVGVPELWFDAADNSTLTVSGGRVTVWANKGSMSGMDAVVASGFTGPALINSSYAGGRQMLRLDGNSQGLITAGNTGLSGTAPRTLFVVFYRAAGSTIMVHMGYPANDQAFGVSDQPELLFWYAYGGGRDITKAATPGNVPHVYSFITGLDGAPSKREGFDNGISYGTLSTTLATVDTPLYIGYRQNWNTTRGDIGEVIVYARTLTSDERQEVERYLLSKWQGAVQGATVSALPLYNEVDIASGATVEIEAGTAAASSVTGPSDATVSVADGASLQITATNAQSFAGVITGAGSLVKRGSHTLSLSGVSDYTGSTAVHGGALIVGALSNGGVASPIGASSASCSNLVLGAATLRYTGSDATVDRGLLIASEMNNRGSLFWVTNNLTLTGPVQCSRGAFLKTGPGTLAFAGANDNVFSANAVYNPNADLNAGANGDGPSQGYSGLNVVEGKLVLGDEGQTNRFAGEAFVGVRSAAEKAAYLDINGGVTVGTTWLGVGRGDSTNGLSSQITVNAGELSVISFSMGYSVNLPGYWSLPALTVNGGAFKSRDIFYLGESAGATATVTVAGGVLRSTSDIRFGHYAGASGTLHLNGGAVECRNLVRGSGAGVVRFNGGVLRALAAGQTFQGMTEATVGAGGARFDTSLADYTVNQALSHLSGLPGADGGLEKAGEGVLTFVPTNSTYTGPTLVSAGTLRLTGSLPTAVTVEDGAAFLYARAGSTNEMVAVTLRDGATFAAPPSTLLRLSGSAFEAQAGSAVTLTNGSAQTLAFSGALTLGAASAAPVSLTLEVAADGASADRLETLGALALGRVDVSLRRMGTAFPYSRDGAVRLIAYPSAQTPDLSGLSVVGGAGGKTYAFSTVADGTVPNKSWVVVTVANDYAASTIWTYSGSGNWSQDSNWSVAPSGAAGSTVRFDSAIGSPATVLLDEASQSAGALYFNNANSYTLAGSEGLTLDNTGLPAQVVVEQGTHVIDRPLVLAAGLDAVPAAGTQLSLTRDISGAGALRVTDGGTVVLTGTNLTGATEVRAGTLKINEPGVLGGVADSVDLNGGVLETTASMTLGGAGQPAMRVGSAGGRITQPAGATLTLGGGEVTGAGTLTVENGTLKPGGAVSAGAFVLNNLAFLNDLGAAVTISQPVSLGGTLSVSAAPADVTLNGAISQTAGKGATALTKRGSGTLTVSGTGAAYNWSSAGQRASVSVEEGMLRFAGASTNTVDTDSGTSQSMYVGTLAGKQAVLRVEQGAMLTLRNDLRAGAAVGATGLVDVAGGVVQAGWLSMAPGNNMNAIVSVSEGGTLRHLRNAGEIGVAGYNSSDTGAYAYLSLSRGGTLDVSIYSGQNFQMGRYGNARVDIDGGTLLCRSWACMGRFSTGFGELNIRGNGLLEHNYENVFGVAELGKGVVNVHQGGVLRAKNFSGTAYGIYLSLGNNGTQRSVMNLLSGGAVEPTRLVASAAGSTVYNSVNFHGGVLRAYTNNAADFLRLRISGTDTARAYVWPEGAVIDSNGKEVTVPEPLAAPTGQGLAAIPVLSGGCYLAPPVLWINGGGGVGGTASAVLDEDGAITNVFITNPGVGYTASPTVEIRGGVPGASAVLGNVTLRSNASGGLTKQGSGTVTLTGAGSSYTGVTSVAGGTLKAATGCLTGTEGYLIKANAVFDLAATAHAVGLLGGSGVVSNGSVTVTGRVSPGDADGQIGALRVLGHTALAVGSGYRFDTDGGTQDVLAVTGDLAIGNRGWIDFGRTSESPLDTPFERLAMTFTGSCVNEAANGTWKVRNAGRPSAGLVAAFEVRGNAVYLSVRFSGTLVTVR